jgi:hypothetical protein
MGGPVKHLQEVKDESTKSFQQQTSNGPSFEKESSRLLTAAVVNRRFRQMLLADPGRAVASGYGGEAFHLRSDERKHFEHSRIFIGRLRPPVKSNERCAGAYAYAGLTVRLPYLPLSLGGGFQEEIDASSLRKAGIDQTGTGEALLL